MAAHTELRLIAKVVLKSDFKTLIKRKLSANMFSEPEARAMFEHLWKYYYNKRHPGKVPTRHYMKNRFPAFRYKDGKTRESIEELCERVREAYISHRLVQIADIVATKARDEPYEALADLRAESMRIQGASASARDLILSDVADDIIREYNMVKHAQGITGVPWPWPELNTVTGGMKPEDFILMYGRLKSMKSFLAILIGVHAYIVAQRRVMFYTAEMSPMLVAKRASACLCGLDYKQVRLGILRPTPEKRFFEELTNLKDEDRRASRHGVAPAFMIASDKDDPRGVGGISHVEAKAEEFEPDLIIVDSFYRMRDDRTGKVDYDWKVQGALSQDLKSMAQRLQVPTIGVTQANRRSEKMSMDEGMEDVAFADAGGQETDFGIRIVKGNKEKEGDFEDFTNVFCIIAAAREMEQDGFLLKFKPFINCHFDGWLTEQQIIDAKTAEKAKRLGKQPADNRTKAEVRSDEAWLAKKRKERQIDG